MNRAQKMVIATLLNRLTVWFFLLAIVIFLAK